MAGRTVANQVSNTLGKLKTDSRPRAWKDENHLCRTAEKQQYCKVKAGQGEMQNGGRRQKSAVKAMETTPAERALVRLSFLPCISGCISSCDQARNANICPKISCLNSYLSFSFRVCCFKMQLFQCFLSSFSKASTIASS